MAKNSHIQWTDHTWNPWRGCKKVSQGCKNCYMFRDQRRYGNDPSIIIRAAKPTFNSPLKWHQPANVFTCSWSDFFIEDADDWRDDAWDIIRRTPHLTYQILTKRPQNIVDRLPSDWGDGWPNVGLGVSIENVKQFKRLESLINIPAAWRFVSAEPLLEFVDFAFRNWHDSKKPLIDWVIVGGESGPNCRKMNPDWARLIQEDCDIASVPFFFKQHGGTRKIDGAWGGRMLNGRFYNEMPQLKEVVPTPNDLQLRLI